MVNIPLSNYANLKSSSSTRHGSCRESTQFGKLVKGSATGLGYLEKIPLAALFNRAAHQQ